MGLAAGAFFVRVSDPKFGGIYITLLNTMGNIGHHWPVTLCLWAVSKLSIKSCIHDEIDVSPINWFIIHITRFKVLF